MDIGRLMQAIGYQFRDKTLLEMALTHPSYGAEHGVPNYQRLEFLGDAVLELKVSNALYRELPDLPEGKLTRMRAALVREESLDESARAFGVRDQVRMSAGEEKSGGRDKSSILSDVLEAIIGAVYLDGGIDCAFGLIDRLLGERLKNPAIEDDPLDFKTRLQEILQQDGSPSPTYEMLETSGPAHQPRFSVRVIHDGSEIGRGSGLSKRSAQQEAARDALSRIEIR